jgi:Arc/MetJ-type ribon-helix-helix transcriptional regulator
MTIHLNAEQEKLILDRVKSGEYSSPEDLIAVALATLIQNEPQFAPGELDALIAEGDADFERGDFLDGEAVFEELRQKSARLRAERGQ